MSIMATPVLLRWISGDESIAVSSFAEVTEWMTAWSAALLPWREKLGVSAPTKPMALFGRLLQRSLHRHDRLAYRHADVVFSARHDAAYLERGMLIDRSGIGRIPQAPAEAFHSSPPVSMSARRARRILHVGGFANWKGVRTVPAVVEQLLAGDAESSMTWV